MDADGRSLVTTLCSAERVYCLHAMQLQVGSIGLQSVSCCEMRLSQQRARTAGLIHPNKKSMGTLLHMGR